MSRGRTDQPMAGPLPPNHKTSCNSGKCEERRPIGEEPVPLQAGPHRFRSAFEFYRKILPSGLISMVNKRPREVSLGKLVEFWSTPSNIRYARNNSPSILSVSSWYLSFQCLNGGEMDMTKALLLNGSFLSQCHDSSIGEVSRFCRNTACLTDKFFKERLPRLREGMLAVENPSTIKRYLQNQLKPMIPSSPGCETMDIILLTTNSQEAERINVGRSAALKHFFHYYSDSEGVSLKHLRFTHNGNTLFLSSASNQTPSQLGINQLDVIAVSNNSSCEAKEEATHSKCTLTKELKTSSSKGSQNIRPRNKTRKARVTPLVLSNPDECDWFRHSKGLSLVFEEVEPKFKKIRQLLNNMNIERSQPKQKNLRAQPNPSMSKSVSNYDNPSTDGLGGKAGKTRYLIQVGEVQNLYKTTKPSIARKKSFFSMTQSQMIELDLHGLTKDEALCKLDEELPKWIDMAMVGSYPWVIPVRVICGGGSQILSEAVDKWIRQNEKVSNAPKNFFNFSHNKISPSR